MEEVRVEIPDWVGDDDDEIASYLADNMDLYEAALDQTANVHDDRSSVDDVSVTNVDVSAHRVVVSYDVDFSAYHGCRDMNYADTHDRELIGRREGRTIIFEKFIPPPPRTTYEEY